MATPVDGRQKTWFCLREAAPVFLVPRSRRENQGVFASSSGLAGGCRFPPCGQVDVDAALGCSHSVCEDATTLFPRAFVVC